MPDSILGVSLFSDLAPDQFGMFNRAFVTLFRIAAGDTWIDSLPMLGPDGDLEWQPSLFVCSFIVCSVWVVLQVSVAVLLDNFVTVSLRMESDEKQKASKEKKAASQFQNPLEPLIAKLANEYTSNESLSSKIRALFHVRSQLVWRNVLVAHSALPAIRMTADSDFSPRGLTKHCLCWQVLDNNDSGELTSQEFCAAMKKLVRP